MNARLTIRRHFEDGQPMVAFMLTGKIPADMDYFPDHAPLANAETVLKLFNGRVSDSDIQQARRQIMVYKRGVRLWVDTKSDPPRLIREEPGKETIRVKIDSRGALEAIKCMRRADPQSLNDVPPEDIDAVCAVQLSPPIDGPAVAPGMLNQLTRPASFFA